MTGTVTLKTRDDGLLFRNPRTCSLSDASMLGHYIHFYRLGMYRERQYELVIDSDGPVVIQPIAIEDVEVMTR